MTYSELEGLDKTESLLDGAADGKVVDGDLAEDTLGVDDEEATERNTLLLNENAVVTGNLLALVSEERKLEVGTETALLAGLGGPGKVGVVRVSRGTYVSMTTCQFRQTAGRLRDAYR